jgi:hypothetical protein
MGNKIGKPAPEYEYKDKASMTIEEQIIDIWKRPLYGLATHKDLPRLISSITLIHDSESKTFDSALDVSVKDFLTTLMNILDPSDPQLETKKKQLEGTSPCTKFFTWQATNSNKTRRTL